MRGGQQAVPPACCACRALCQRRCALCPRLPLVFFIVGQFALVAAAAALPTWRGQVRGVRVDGRTLAAPRMRACPCPCAWASRLPKRSRRRLQQQTSDQQTTCALPRRSAPQTTAVVAANAAIVLLWPLLPESGRWLLVQGRKEEATQVRPLG